MILIHVRDRALLGGDQFLGARKVGQHIVRRQIRGAREAAIEMRRGDSHAPEREIAEAGVKLRLRMAREEAPPHARLVGALLLDAREGAEHGQARMRQRIALAGLGEQHRGAAVGLEVRRMGGKPRGQDHRRAVHVGRDLHQRGERMAGIAVERAERAGPGRPQQGLGERLRIEVGGRPRAFGQAVRHRAGQQRRLASVIASLPSVHQTPPAKTKAAQKELNATAMARLSRASFSSISHLAPAATLQAAAALAPQAAARHDAGGACRAAGGVQVRPSAPVVRDHRARPAPARSGAAPRGPSSFARRRRPSGTPGLARPAASAPSPRPAPAASAGDHGRDTPGTISVLALICRPLPPSPNPDPAFDPP